MVARYGIRCCSLFNDPGARMPYKSRLTFQVEPAAYTALDRRAGGAAGWPPSTTWCTHCLDRARGLLSVPTSILPS